MQRRIRIGSWRFDPATGELTTRDTRRRLEPRVAQVLSYLAARPGQVVTKAELLESIWTDTHVVDAVIWRAVSGLRRAFDDDAGNPKYVETVSRRGYRLVAPVRPISQWAPLRVAAVLALTAALTALAASLVPSPARPARDGSNTLSEHIKTVPTTATDLTRIGLQHYRRYRAADNRIAAEFFRRALELDPDHASAIAGLADTTTLAVDRFSRPSSELDTAVDLALRAVELDPLLPEAHKALGLALMASGRISAGLSASQRAVELRPEYAEAHNNVAGALAARGKLVDALDWRMRQPLPHTDTALHLYRIGELHARLGSESSARRYLENALAAEPHYRWAAIELARLDLAANDYAAAIARADRLLAVHPECGGCWELRGQIEFERNSWQEARRFFEASIAADNHDSTAGIRLAQLDALDGDTERAEAILDRLAEFTANDIQTGSERWELRWDLARVSALRGAPERALDWLREAIALGLADPTLLRRESSLEALRAKPDFVDLVEELEHRAGIGRRLIGID